MTREQWLKVLADISAIGDRQIIEISGGEPMIKKDLSLEIAHEGRRLGLEMSLNTNGALVDERTADDILRAGFASVKISLYSLDENIHDKLRDVSGAGAKAKNALDLLKKKNRNNQIKIEIGMLLTSLNIDGINDMVGYCQENQFDLIIQPLDCSLERSYQENWQASSGLWLKKEQIEKYLWPLIKNKPRAIKNPPFYLKLIYQYYLDPNSINKRKCLAPYNDLIIAPNGDARLCFRGESIGNIGEKKIKEIWQSKEARQERKRLRFCQKSCKIAGCNMRRQIRDFFC